jgi:hypothetical protein
MASTCQHCVRVQPSAKVPLAEFKSGHNLDKITLDRAIMDPQWQQHTLAQQAMRRRFQQYVVLFLSIRCELGIHRHVFAELIAELREMGHSNSKYVSLEEQLAIFLYACVTGLTIQHIGEQFQRSNETIPL